ncbi:hypothetical protein KUV64_10415 [Mameliella alba]|uniref:hypothetical protein n=1 Tax=Mameliella TaxID=1434019 RepID=UPI0010556BE2|nr:MULTISPECIES: hypothetical protein [Mameliella]MBY6119545.1 hypothetical protein [Mameliella alba]MCR9272196.1 hypothetical protein [Paracoccaceae bacterium]MDD9730971.1 hypothetical protein [Mameliella sp. AT18]
MPNLYDEIMNLLHEAGAFAEVQRQERLNQAVRHAKQTAETELFSDLARQNTRSRACFLSR